MDMIDIECENCRKVFKREIKKVKKNLVSGKKNMCSDRCKGLYVTRNKTVTLIEVNCSNCNAGFMRRPCDINDTNNFCTRKCFTSWQVRNFSYENSVKYVNGATLYRKRAFENYEHKCNNCGYDTYKEMLEVHHIDSNRENNALENLEILCAWCHHFKTVGIPYHKWNGIIK